MTLKSEKTHEIGVFDTPTSRKTSCYQSIYQSRKEKAQNFSNTKAKDRLIEPKNVE